ncbi:septum site-determining protein MinC [Spirulina sp. CCNP1310]|uniref:septum site-determining protein MinC n=1 Tax=Spirulina sp. CCNP1310 TaxID=3110249 RepID=UPI002B20D2F5|nr:septum site-determining protein MinC [Spirulina sp. CCNP1310]MEA5419033.1 septum site-determining protein MinC [Spirulina sp. CCNP1310]
MPADSDAELSPAPAHPAPEAKPSVSEPEPAPADSQQQTKAIALKNPQAQVRLSRKDTVVQVWLPDPDQTPTHWLEIWDRLKQRLSTGERFWQAGTVAHLLAGKHLLDGRQLQAIAEALAQAQLDLRTVATCRRQTAVVAAGAGYSVEQTLPQTTAAAPVEGSAETWAEPLYLKSTVRSGIEVSHPGTVVVFGDTNPGSEIIATGDILVVGRLRGIAHAGAEGNRACQIFALKMEAVQLRIAEAIARPPATPIDQLYPEIAYITANGIRLAPAPNFFKTHSFSMATESWVESP